MRKQPWLANLQNLIAPIVLVAVWQLTVGELEIPARYLPSPSVILSVIADRPAAFGGAMAITLFEAVIGIVAGTVVGILSGMIFFRSRLLERMFFPYFVASQAVPIIAFGALVVMWFGNGIASKAFVALYLTFFPVAVNTLRGLRSVDPHQVDLLRTFGATPAVIFRKLQFPGALPSIFTAVRLGASLGLIGAIVGEWFGASCANCVHTCRSSSAIIRKSRR